MAAPRAPAVSRGRATLAAMGLLISWLAVTMGLWLASRIIPGFRIGEIKDAAVVAIVFGVLNWLLGWLLFVIIGIGTLGIPLLLGLGFLVRWVVLTLVLKLTDALMERLKIDGWAPAFWAAAVISAVSVVVDWLV
jgi:putative membrane protein